MNGILAKSSESNKLQGVLSPKPSVETAGSLAMNFHSLFEGGSYDMFYTNNPFAVDYTLYADCNDSVAYNGFLNSFSNAVSTLGDSGFSDGGFTGCSDCGSSGGFTSVC